MQVNRQTVGTTKLRAERTLVVYAPTAESDAFIPEKSGPETMVGSLGNRQSHGSIEVTEGLVLLPPWFDAWVKEVSR